MTAKNGSGEIDGGGSGRHSLRLEAARGARIQSGGNLVFEVTEWILMVCA
jgi:hypothetical protein